MDRDRGILFAILAAAAMIAAQVAAKAARDAFFLSNYSITALPAMVIVSALLSALIVLAMSGKLRDVGPARVVPWLFTGSGVLLAIQWAVSLRWPKLAALLVYLHVAGLGSALISGFWSIVTERFADPRAAKRQVARIASGGTVGAIVGGLLAERIGAHFGLTSILLLLAALHIFCGWATRALVASAADSPGDLEPDGFGVGHEAGQSLAARLKLLGENSYLRNLGLMLVLVMAGETLVDYIFKAEAVRIFAQDGGALIRFFALFYVGIAVITFLIQALLSLRLLEKLGLARTAATLPCAVGIGGVANLFFPGLVGASILRGVEAALQNSLFRSGYELLFSPIPAREKRAIKSFIDVGCQRIGDVSGGGIVQLALILGGAAAAARFLLPTIVVLSAAGIFMAYRLHRGWVEELALSLALREEGGEIDGDEDSLGIGSLKGGMPSVDILHALSNLERQPSWIRDARAASPRDRAPLVRQIGDLCSDDTGRIRAVLAIEPLPEQLATQVIPLLEREDLAREIMVALGGIAEKIVGQLEDALLDPGTEDSIRRRIPRILRSAATQRSADALMAGLADRHYQVRYHCGKALAFITKENPEISVSEEGIFAAISRELVAWGVRSALRAEQEHGKRQAGGGSAQGFWEHKMKHIFDLLSLVLPRAPLLVAYRGYRSQDAVTRGTALEYLETSLPKEVRDALWGYITGEFD